ncbi:MAG: hypothetical protein ACFE9N_12565, partial [Promethearchaeota archaeon]
GFGIRICSAIPLSISDRIKLLSKKPDGIKVKPRTKTIRAPANFFLEKGEIIISFLTEVFIDIMD